MPITPKTYYKGNYLCIEVSVSDMEYQVFVENLNSIDTEVKNELNGAQAN